MFVCRHGVLSTPCALSVSFGASMAAPILLAVMGNEGRMGAQLRIWLL